MFLAFYCAEKISVFHWIRVIGQKANKNKDKKPFVLTYIFPEIWAVGNLLFAGAVSLQLLKEFRIKWLAWILVSYSVIRTFEMIIYQINVLFFHRLNNDFFETPTSGSSLGERGEYKIKSATRTVLLLLINMAEYIFQFAVMYAGISILTDDNMVKIGIIQSFQLFRNVSGINDCPNKALLTPIYAETLVGIFMNILCLARFINILLGVKTIDNR